MSILIILFEFDKACAISRNPKSFIFSLLHKNVILDIFTMQSLDKELLSSILYSAGLLQEL